jgi:hypothetical protein
MQAVADQLARTDDMFVLLSEKPDTPAGFRLYGSVTV